MKNKLYLFFSILFCLATLFMGVGYASINSISLNISGEVIAQAQEGIFITEVKYNDELSNNVSVDDSKINSAYQTNLDSSIVLSNNNDSQITYDITIYNSYDLAYVFDGIEYTVGENTYSNENITYKLTNLVEGNTVNSNDDISFSITFYFKDSSNISDVELKSLLNFKFSIASYVVDTFEYTGNYETFTVPHTGIYKIELWGAQGGTSVCQGTLNCATGGSGAYTSGNINLIKNQKFYLYIGEKGENADISKNSLGGYNGGGDGSWDNHDDESSGAGGGSTDIRLSFGSYNSFESLKSRIMVAAAGSGAAWKERGASGGGLHGLVSLSESKIPTQTYGYKFGMGESGIGEGGGSDGVSGAGSGYYGGYASSIYIGDAGGKNYTIVENASSGSSFISGHNGCDAITETSTEDNIIHTGQSIHYSGYQFTDTVMIDGEGYNWTTERGSLTGMPTHDGAGSMIGNSGNGYAKITFVSE